MLCWHKSPKRGRLKGKCALGPFLSILVIECQRKCFCVDLCNVVDKVQIMSKAKTLLSLGAPDCPVVHQTVSDAPDWLGRTGRSREIVGDVRL
jgi:hypothetical protein